jgi:O-antigen/teichoic acid export membrane protein
VGAIITLALNFLLIPTMSYYGSAIATIAAYGSMMSISYWEQILSHSLRFKKIGYLSLSILFQPYHFMVSERIIGIGLLIVFYILSITMKSTD